MLTLGLLLALAGAAFYASWHGDALEADRHALTAAIQLRIGLWIATVLVVDVLAGRRLPGARRSMEGGPGEGALDREQERGAPDDDERRDLDPAPSGAG